MKITYKERQPNIFEQLAYPCFQVSEDYQIIDSVLSDSILIKKLSCDFPDVRIGRHRISIEQILRILVLKHQKQLSYRELYRQLKYDMEDRWFCMIEGKTPCFKTLQNQISLIKDDTIKSINTIVMQKAKELKLTQGKRLRVDSTVTEMNIHYPTDASLISDGIRIVGRLLGKQGLLPGGYRWIKGSLKRQINLLRTIGRRNKEVSKTIIKKIVSIGKRFLAQTQGLGGRVIKAKKELLEKVIRQTEQVLKGGKNIRNRIVSLVEPTARVIRRGRAGKPNEFGKVVQIQEDEHFVTGWQISGKKQDEEYLSEALDKHKQIHDRYPEEIATDRGYWSKDNYNKVKKLGIKHISIPKKGKCNTEEKHRQTQYKFKKLQRWRAGGEAKISWLKRSYGLDRSLYRGDDGIARWVGAGLLANNLTVLVKLIIS